MDMEITPTRHIILSRDVHEKPSYVAGRCSLRCDDFRFVEYVFDQFSSHHPTEVPLKFHVVEWDAERDEAKQFLSISITKSFAVNQFGEACGWSTEVLSKFKNVASRASSEASEVSEFVSQFNWSLFSRASLTYAQTFSGSSHL